MSLEKYIRENRQEFDDEKLPDSVRSDFEVRLRSELHSKKSSPSSSGLRYVYFALGLLVFLVIAYFVNEGSKERREVRDNLVLALGDDQTNSTRLGAIYEINDLYADQKEDEKILEAFFKILREDSDSNSKIAVIDALLKFPKNQDVRGSLISALGTETEPLVQLKLIKSVAILREQRAKESLQRIIQDKESLPVVKGNASASLAMLNK